MRGGVETGGEIVKIVKILEWVAERLRNLSGNTE